MNENDILNCDYFYKVDTPEGFKFYGVKVLTTDAEQVNALLDQMNKAKGIYINEYEFRENVTDLMLIDLMSDESEIIAHLYCENINLK